MSTPAAAYCFLRCSRVKRNGRCVRSRTTA
jgi:hypothetical protein